MQAKPLLRSKHVKLSDPRYWREKLVKHGTYRNNKSVVTVKCHYGCLVRHEVPRRPNKVTKRHILTRKLTNIV